MVIVPVVAADAGSAVPRASMPVAVARSSWRLLMVCLFPCNNMHPAPQFDAIPRLGDALRYL
jgi:hypothetical protein